MVFGNVLINEPTLAGCPVLTTWPMAGERSGVHLFVQFDLALIVSLVWASGPRTLKSIHLFVSGFVYVQVGLGLKLGATVGPIADMFADICVIQFVAIVSGFAPCLELAFWPIAAYLTTLEVLDLMVAVKVRLGFESFAATIEIAFERSLVRMASTMTLERKFAFECLSATIDRTGKRKLIGVDN